MVIRTNLLLTAVIGASFSGVVSANEPVAAPPSTAGIVRITDQADGGHAAGSTEAVDYSSAGDCPDADCRVQRAPLTWEERVYRRRHGTVYSYDYGWAPPGFVPYERASVGFNRWYPHSWTGEQAPPYDPAMVRPQVYYPTDTTQLGYTYQHTPHWIRYCGMVPPVPNPHHWHTPLCGPGGCPGGCPGGNCRQDMVSPDAGPIVDQGVAVEAQTPGVVPPPAAGALPAVAEPPVEPQANLNPANNPGLLPVPR